MLSFKIKKQGELEIKRLSNFILSTLLIFAIVLLSSSCQNSNYILKIGETEVPKEEYRIVMSSLKDETMMHYSKNYNETDFSKSFWKREYPSGSITPIEYLNEKTIEKIKENHAILNMAKKEKLIENDSFEFIYRMFEEENLDRSQNQQNEEEIYGVSSFTIEEYYEYLISNLSVNLRSILSENLTEQEIDSYYEKNKDKMFCEPSIYECEQVLIEGYSESSEIKNTVQKIIHKVKQGEELKNLVYNQGMTINKVEYDMSQVRSLSIRYPLIIEALNNMDVGDVKLIEDSPNAYILKVCSKSDEKYIPLEKVKENVKTYLSMEKLDTKIRKSVSETKYKINKRLIDKIDSPI